MTSLFFDNALLPDGWAKNVCLTVDEQGWITQITQGDKPGGISSDALIALPGMPNLHSHAFQRAMAGMAESKGATEDSFWTWRQAMYRFVERLTPIDLSNIARQVYIEMLEAGFTSVAEFHYLHHDQFGTPYTDIGEMSEAIADAATHSGIGLTLLPVFYAYGGPGGQSPSDGQRRFINSPDSYAKLFSRAQDIVDKLPDASVGIAPHSLRAVTPETLETILSLSTSCPVHIHIAEQIKEVEEIINWSGQRSVEWLFDHTDVDRRWCLIHATHLTTAERKGIAKSGATAGICPITEANLGDGIFDGVQFLSDGGCFGIGSDSNIYISVAEELRLLEYSQRLRDQSRNLLTTSGSTGRALFEGALSGGAEASGRKIGKLDVGYRADVVSLDATHPALMCRDQDGWLDSWIFAGDNQVISNVWVGGKQVVKEGRHINRDSARAAFKQSISGLLSA